MQAFDVMVIQKVHVLMMMTLVINDDGTEAFKGHRSYVEIFFCVRV